MFRDLYKKANEDIKGDRAILDRAFLKAAQPEKKKNPVFKYSFIGTVVAAVVLVGAVFANPTVFTNRSKDIGTLTEPTEAESVALTAALNDEIAVAEVFETEEAVEVEADAARVTKTKNVVINKTVVDDTAQKEAVNPDSGSGGGMDNKAAEEEEPDGEDEYSVAVMSLDGEDDAVVEAVTEEQVKFKIVRPEKGDSEEATEEADEEATEESTSEVEMFSYMYDMSIYEGITEGFKNTDVSPVANSYDAIERAKNECMVEYDSIAVYHDAIEKVWKVSFYKEDTPGESVYMNCDGITTLIVYGE